MLIIENRMLWECHLRGLFFYLYVYMLVHIRQEIVGAVYNVRIYCFDLQIILPIFLPVTTTKKRATFVENNIAVCVIAIKNDGLV